MSARAAAPTLPGAAEAHRWRGLHRLVASASAFDGPRSHPPRQEEGEETDCRQPGTEAEHLDDAKPVGQ